MPTVFQHGAARETVRDRERPPVCRAGRCRSSPRLRTRWERPQFPEEGARSLGRLQQACMLTADSTSAVGSNQHSSAPHHTIQTLPHAHTQTTSHTRSIPLPPPLPVEIPDSASDAALEHCSWIVGVRTLSLHACPVAHTCSRTGKFFRVYVISM